MNKNKILIKLFSIVWRKRLNGTREEREYHKSDWSLVSPYPYKVIKVKGWRTALISSRGGQRITMTFLFKIFEWYL